MNHLKHKTMFLNSLFGRETSSYKPLTNGETENGSVESFDATPKGTLYVPGDGKARRYLSILIPIFISLVAFAAGVLAMQIYIALGDNLHDDTEQSIPLLGIQREFIYNSPFSREPPQVDGSGEISEPIWDELIPNGLGYFRDEHLALNISIPTVFHQLHCLYLLRRAYYSQSDDLQEFDFGKDRVSHVAHCFDYLLQGLTCSVDTTIEPAVNEADGFLGSGFSRQCKDFEGLKEFVEERRVFNASGFLAHGLDHGHVHIL
ncbi:hypothetical protein F5B19DRAFT_468785 [Rostrohypoxylon terebratum]|nr:hypothetical protein F5B19DRAFT_468785 [Rostrohypoxylon terebratum]